MMSLPAVAAWKLGQDNRQFNASMCIGKVEVATKGIKCDRKNSQHQYGRIIKINQKENGNGDTQC